MHNIVCGWCSRKFHTKDKCFSKQRGEPKAAQANKVADNKKKTGNGNKGADDISKKEKKLQRKKRTVKSVKSEKSEKSGDEEESEDETDSEGENDSKQPGTVKSVRMFVKKVSGVPAASTDQLTGGNRLCGQQAGGKQLRVIADRLAVVPSHDKHTDKQFLADCGN